jgi:hypothetical protein
MNHLIDWCQVSSISALFLTELLLQVVNYHVSKKEIRHCISAVSWPFDCWKTQMVVGVYFVMIHQRSFRYVSRIFVVIFSFSFNYIKQLCGKIERRKKALNLDLPDLDSNPWSTTRVASTLTITLPMWLYAIRVNPPQ